MMTLLGAMHAVAAQRGDGLRPELVTAISEAAPVNAGQSMTGADHVQTGRQDVRKENAKHDWRR
jgi:hypothetical protein